MKRHSLSLASAGVLLVWILLYTRADHKTHLGSFYGNAIADWSGVVATVIATKYLYEVSNAKKRQHNAGVPNRLRQALRDHSLTIFLFLTGTAWVVLYLKMDSEAKWGQVVGNIVSEWTQILGLVLMTKRLIERKASEK